MDAFGERLRETIEASPIAGVLTNPRLDDNPIVAVNAAFVSLTGYAEEEILGRNCRFLAGEDTDPEATRRLREAITDERPIVTELVNYRKDGSAFRNAVIVAPCRDENGKTLYFIGSQMAVEPANDEAHERKAKALRLIARLTPRQRQVARLMGTGLRNKQIAFALGVSEKTVKMHRAAMLKALGAATSAEAMRIVTEAGQPG